MIDEPMPPRGLIAAYKTCARPSAAREAQLWATLAEAERAAKARARRPAPRVAPWLALAAVLVLVAWGLDLPRRAASGHVLRDISQQAAHGAATASPEAVEAAGKATREPEATTDVVGGPAVTGPAGEPRRGPNDARGATKPADEARSRQAPARELPDEDGAQPLQPEGAVEDDGDRVLAEMALLQRAQAALRGGRPGEALELLAQHAERFADGSMAEERQALRVLALCAAGQTASGSAEQAAFLRAYPRSTYAPRVISACAQEQDPKDISRGP
jgi:hypothetical protein